MRAIEAERLERFQNRRQLDLSHVKDHEWAWLAAMIDGEGCFRAQCSRRRNVTRSLRQNLALGVSNTCRPLLEECDRILPYGRITAKNRSYRPQHAQVYIWTVNAADALVAVIRGVYPFLIAKRVQATLAYNYAQMVVRRNAECLRDTRRLTDEELDRRQWLAKSVQALNKRRHIDMPEWCEEVAIL